MAIPQEFSDILTGRNTNLRLQVVTDEQGRQMVTAVNSDGEAKGDMVPLDQFVGQAMPNPYGGAQSASTISYNDQTGQFGDAQSPEATAYLNANYPGMGLVHQNMGTDRFIDPSKVYDTPYGRVTAQNNVKAGAADPWFTPSPLSLFALAMGIPTLPGGGSGLSSLLDAAQSATGLGQAGSAGDLAQIQNAVSGGVAPVSTGSVPGTADFIGVGAPSSASMSLDPLAVNGNTAFTSGLAAPGSAAALSGLTAYEQAAGLAPAASMVTGATAPASTMPNPGAPVATASEITGTSGPATATAGTGAAASLLNSIFKTSLTDADTSLIGKLLATGLGGIGAAQQSSASSDLARQFMDMGKPYRDSLASLEANPAAYYQSPEVQGALQQGSDSLARSLSAKVGNPILNPTALQEMQNYTTNGLLGQLNQRRNFLASAGGLGTSQAASLGNAATQASGGVYNALGAGLGSVFGNQRDYASELLDLLKNNRSTGLGGVALP